MSKRKRKKKPVGLILMVVLLTLAALVLAYMILSRAGIIPDLFAQKASTQTESQVLTQAETSEEAAPETTEETPSEESEEVTEEAPEESSEEPTEEEQETESSEEEIPEETESSEPVSEEDSTDEDSEASSEDTEASGLPALTWYYYMDEIPAILSHLEMGSVRELAAYVGESGVELAPTGVLADSDVILTREEMADFMSLGTRNYGTSASSGQDLVLSPAEYFTRFISPVDLDFAAANTLENDLEDLALCDKIPGARTVSFYYTPSSMEWRKIILVFSQDGTSTGGDALRAIIYKDMTTY